MKLSGAAADAFIRQPDPAVRAVLVYGPDEGQVRERAAQLTRSVCPDLHDPFRIADIPPTALKDDPARIADELRGARLRRRTAGWCALSGVADAQAAPIVGFLSHPLGMRC
jgi:DNA polymerase-3 subunit delta